MNTNSIKRFKLGIRNRKQLLDKIAIIPIVLKITLYSYISNNRTESLAKAIFRISRFEKSIKKILIKTLGII